MAMTLNFNYLACTFEQEVDITDYSSFLMK